MIHRVKNDPFLLPKFSKRVARVHRPGPEQQEMGHGFMKIVDFCFPTLQVPFIVMADRGKPKQFRKRGRNSDDEGDDDAVALGGLGRSAASSSSSSSSTTSAAAAPSVLRAAPSASARPSAQAVNVFGTSTKRAGGGGDDGNVASASLSASSSSSSSSPSTSSTSILATLAHASSGTGTSHAYGGGAFAYSQIDTSEDKDARTQLEHRIAMHDVAVADMEAGRKVYRGQAGYTNFIAKDVNEAVTAGKAKGTLGPARAPVNVRGICRIDYQADICKDYKETGQCPFGDSCIFLHDRSDYKSGWQIELDWAAQQKKKAAKLAARLAAGRSADSESSSDEVEEGKAAGKGGQGKKGKGDGKEEAKKKTKGEGDEEELPFACYICRKPFTSPIQTQCGHYFCEPCAVSRHRSNPLCAVCGKGTMGIFNSAPPRMLARIKARKEAEEAAAAAAGASSSSSLSSSSSTAPGSGGGTTKAGKVDEGDSTPSSASGDGDSDASTGDEAGAKGKRNQESGGGGGWATVVE
jgi:RING finger protein 113A